MAVYLIVGILFMKYKNNASGIEIIPNSSLWIEMPGNIKVTFLSESLKNYLFHFIFRMEFDTQFQKWDFRIHIQNYKITIFFIYLNCFPILYFIYARY
jgi:hypothetical protein